MQFKSDEARFKTMKEKLFSAVLSDALDKLGYREQAMRHDIRPIDPDSVVCGRAHTWLWKVRDAMGNKEYLSAFDDMDKMNANEVMVHSTDYTLGTAPSLHAAASLGEGNAKTMMNRGCVGVVTDRLIRDAKNIIKMGLPVFCRGIKPNPSPSRTGIAAINVPVLCGDVLVNPGDIVFGDYDGIVVIPREAEDKVINLALEMLEHEEFVEKGLSAGKSLHDVLQEWNRLHPDKAISWH